MRYFVVAQDGQRYGPVNLATLNDWIAQGRVLPTTLLEDAEFGGMVTAGNVAGTVFSPHAPPPVANFANYPRATQPDWGRGNDELTKAWIFTVISCVVCPFILNLLGLHFATNARNLGHPGAQACRIVNIVMLCLWGLLIVALFASILLATPTAF